MRRVFSGTSRDGAGNVVSSATVKLFEAGGTTAATFYSSATSTSGITSTTSGSDGTFSIYVDNFDYDAEQTFKITIEKAGYSTKTFDNVRFDDVVLGTYTISADRTVTTNLVVPKGVIYSIATGKTLTISGPFEAGDYQVFSCVGTGKVAGLKESRPVWFGSSGIGTVELALAATATDGNLIIGPGTYYDVVVEKDNITMVLDRGALFKTSAEGLVPAIRFSGCDNLEIQGQLRADGNKTNNTDLGTEADLDYLHATVGIYNSTYLTIPDIYVTNAWHDGVTIEAVTNSRFGDIRTKDSHYHGVVIYDGAVGNEFGRIISDGTSHTHAIRIGGATGGTVVEKNTFELLKGINSSNGGLLIEHDAKNLQIGKVYAQANGTSGGKISDSGSITIGEIYSEGNGGHGFAIQTENENVSDIVIGSIVSKGNGTSTTTQYEGVYIYSKEHTLSQISIGRIVSTGNGNATKPSSGVYIVNYDAAGSIIQDVNIGSVLTTNNYGHGLIVVDDRSIERVHINSLISNTNNLKGTTYVDANIQYLVGAIQIDSIEIGTRSERPSSATCKQLKYASNGAGYETHVSERTVDLTANAGAGVKWDSAIPAETITDYITAYVTEEITFSGGGANWTVGTAVNKNRWGSSATLTVGALENISGYDATDAGPFYNQAALDIWIYPDAGAFTKGTVRIGTQYRYQSPGRK